MLIPRGRHRRPGLVRRAIAAMAVLTLAVLAR